MEETNELLRAILAELRKMNERADVSVRVYEERSKEAEQALEKLKSVLPPAMKGVLDGL